MIEPTAYLVSWPAQPGAETVHLADALPEYYEQHALSVITPLYPPSDREQQLEKLLEEARLEIIRLKDQRQLYPTAPGETRAGFSCGGVNLEGRKSDIDAVAQWRHNSVEVLPAVMKRLEALQEELNDKKDEAARSVFGNIGTMRPWEVMELNGTLRQLPPVRLKAVMAAIPVILQKRYENKILRFGDDEYLFRIASDISGALRQVYNGREIFDELDDGSTVYLIIRMILDNSPYEEIQKVIFRA